MENTNIYFQYGPKLYPIAEPGFVGMISGNRAAGKCLGINTPILMYDGSIKKVQDVEVGDILMGPDSRPRNVLRLARGRQNLYKVIQNRGMDYVVNESHIMSVRKVNNIRYASKIVDGERVRDKSKILRDKSRDIENLPLLELKARVEKNTFGRESYKGYHSGPLKFSGQDQSLIKVDPYLLGMWLGDGNLDSPRITTQDKEVVQAVETIVSNKYKKLAVKEYYSDKSKANLYSITGNRGNSSNEFIDDLRELGLYGVGKFIPKQYLTSSISCRMELLAGILDSDGHKIKDTCFSITQKSERFIDEIAFLCRSLGLGVTKSIKNVRLPNTDTYRDYYRLHITGDCKSIPNRIEYKKITVNSTVDTLTSLLSFEPLGEGDYYGFTIDGDSLFLLGDMTVTHNSTFTEPIMISAMTLGNPEANYTVRSDKGIVTHIDTELPESLHKKMGNRLFKKSGLSRSDFNDRYDYHNLVNKVSFKAKREEVYKILDESNSSLYVIDNITGLSDPNDKDTAYELAYKFNAVAREKGAVILPIGHVNNDNTARGWLGKVMEEVGSLAIVLSIYNEAGITIVSFEKDRLDGIPVTSFTVNPITKSVVPGPYLPFPV